MFLVVLGFGLRALHLLGRHRITRAKPSPWPFLFYSFWDRFSQDFLGQPEP
jgi:hypothetical protein